MIVLTNHRETRTAPFVQDDFTNLAARVPKTTTKARRLGDSESSDDEPIATLGGLHKSQPSQDKSKPSDSKQRVKRRQVPGVGP